MLTAKMVKMARLLMGWTQAELAFHSGLAVSTIADFEREARSPTERTFQLIEKAFDKFDIRFEDGVLYRRKWRPVKEYPLMEGFYLNIELIQEETRTICNRVASIDEVKYFRGGQKNALMLEFEYLLDQFLPKIEL